jgi:quercetin dioxygenase-like cupin family protein
MSTDFTEDPNRRQRYQFRREGDVLHVEVWVQPGGDVPPHFHPSQEERFEVVSGKMRVHVDGKAQTAGPGERLTAPRGSVHKFKNVGSEEAHVRVEVEPALQLQEFLEEAAALARAGKYTRRGVPKGFRAALEVAEFADRYSDTAVVTVPPPALTRPLARLARRRGVVSPAAPSTS